ncbi:unnamed protein product [Sphenostylis stenocarpa]|uniref:Uncharacterized protein n=1 Tax=Sphenostylis stenocarpa TaxID=92480 RepID=A0AA86W6G7_9FABA|nr:unnamed protein product [Sphenostylis stenocarpa]
MLSYTRAKKARKAALENNERAKLESVAGKEQLTYGTNDKGGKRTEFKATNDPASRQWQGQWCNSRSGQIIKVERKDTQETCRNKRLN